MKRLLIFLAMTILSLGIFAQSRYEKVRQVYRSLGYNIGLEEFAKFLTEEVKKEIEEI